MQLLARYRRNCCDEAMGFNFLYSHGGVRANTGLGVASRSRKVNFCGRLEITGIGERLAVWRCCRRERLALGVQGTWAENLPGEPLL